MDMIQSLKLVVATVIVVGIIAGQLPVARKKERAKRMNEEIQLIWNATAETFEDRQQVYFVYSAGHGLTDIDFHPITAREWDAMKSPTAVTVARLQVGKETTFAQIEETIRQLTEKGGYKTIVITARL